MCGVCEEQEACVDGVEKELWGWGRSSELEHVPSMNKAPSSVSRTVSKRNLDAFPSE